MLSNPVRGEQQVTKKGAVRISKSLAAFLLFAHLAQFRKQATVDDTLMSRKEFFAQVDKGLAEIKRGEGIFFTNKDDMNAWLNTL